MTSHPLPRADEVKFTDVVENTFVDPTSFRYSNSLTLSIGLFISVFLVFPLIERITNAKQVQIMTGVHPGLFWMANLVYDSGIILVSSTLTTILLYALDQQLIFSTNGAAGMISHKKKYLFQTLVLIQKYFFIDF